LLGNRRILIRIQIHTFDCWIRIQEPQKHVDPVDPDPDSGSGSATLPKTKKLHNLLISNGTYLDLHFLS
jgi:hypothetical protein